MEAAKDSKSLKETIDRVMKTYKQDIQLGKEPPFGDLAQLCRQENRIKDEIKILKLAVDFYENVDAADQKTRVNLAKFKRTLNDRKKEAKVLKMLNWES